MLWNISQVLAVVGLCSVPYFAGFLIGETRRRLRVGHWR